MDCQTDKYLLDEQDAGSTPVLVLSARPHTP